MYRIPVIARTLALVGFTALLAVSLAAQDAGRQIGRIEYLEGDVTIIREDRALTANAIRAGAAIRALDVIQTGYDGYVEVRIDTPLRATLRIAENTAYYIEVTGGEGGEPAGSRGVDDGGINVRLLAGRIAVAADAVPTGSRLGVATGSAAFGVRGTVFDIVTTPDDAVLLGVREGAVAVDSAPRPLVAQAGIVVEQLADRAPEASTVGEDLDSYYESWEATRLQVFRSGAPTFVRAYAARYLDMRDRFDESSSELIAFRSRIAAALSGDASTGALMTLRREVSPAVIRVRSILPLYEDTVYRLGRLSQFHRQGIGVTEIDRSLSSRAFFADFDRREAAIQIQLARVRTMLLLVSQLEEQSLGGLPGGVPGGLPGGIPIERPRF